jgi:hypothetical protein
MIDSALFMLAQDITDENVLAVLAALQAFENNAISKVKGWNSVYKDGRKQELEITLVCPERYAFLFASCLTKVKGIYQEAADIPAVTYHYVSYISIERAKALAACAAKPLAVAIGIMIGAEANVLPDVSNLVLDFVKDKAQILATTDSLANIISQKSNVSDVWVAQLTASLRARILAVYHSDCVIGESSFETYLGCCLSKPVLEIQQDMHLFKWSNKLYTCITDATDKEVVLKGVDRCLQQALEK